jgi:hypothetical protein
MFHSIKLKTIGTKKLSIAVLVFHPKKTLYIKSFCFEWWTTKKNNVTVTNKYARNEEKHQIYIRQASISINLANIIDNLLS